MKKNERKLENTVFGFAKFSESAKDKVHLTICFGNYDKVTENTFSSKLFIFSVNFFLNLLQSWGFCKDSFCKEVDEESNTQKVLNLTKPFDKT